MAIVFRCEKCGRRYKVAEDRVGQTAQCRSCGAELRVPVPGPEVETSPTTDQPEAETPMDQLLKGGPAAAAFPQAETTSADEAVTQHIERYLGEIEGTFQDAEGTQPFIDVQKVWPRANQSHGLPSSSFALITRGMSAFPMTVSEGAEDYEFAELMLCLPDSWPLESENLEDENVYWPLRLLKTLARLPHIHRTWIGLGHCIPNNTPPQPYAPDVDFTNALLWPPQLVDKPFRRLKLIDGRVIHFYAVIPLYQDESDYMARSGLERMLKRLHRYGVTELLDTDRKSSCRKWFGFLG